MQRTSEAVYCLYHRPYIKSMENTLLYILKKKLNLVERQRTPHHCLFAGNKRTTPPHCTASRTWIERSWHRGTAELRACAHAHTGQRRGCKHQPADKSPLVNLPCFARYRSARTGPLLAPSVKPRASYNKLHHLLGPGSSAVGIVVQQS